MTQLLLIRHAHNDWVGNRLAGWTPGVHLNDKGRQEATALAARLAGYRIDAIYASPLDRAMETAQPLADARGLTVQPLLGVAEVQFGAWTGESLKELSKLPLWAGVQHYPSVTRFPDGETLGEVQARAVAALDAVHASHPGGVAAVVSHADVLKTVLAYYLGVHLDLFQRLEIDPASLSIVRLTPGGPRIIMINDTGSVPPPPEPTPAEADPPQTAPAGEGSGAADTPATEPA